MVGDLNADLSDRCSCLLNKLQFCDDNSLILSSHLLSPAESYSYISEAWHTTSWLDHCISTADAIHAHVPFVMSLDVDSVPEMTYEVNSASKAKLYWAKLSNEDVILWKH